MSRDIIERLKTVFICILIIIGLIQIGILWSYQNQGTPISFLAGLFSKDTHISDETVSEKLFAPDKLILSDGEITYWLIRNNDEYYKTFWDEAVFGLRQIAAGNIEINQTNEKWEDIIDRRGLLIDFGYTVEPDLLGWFLGMGSPVQEMPAFSKIMIKRDIIDNKVGFFYLYGINGTIYYSNPIKFDKAGNLAVICKKLIEEEADRHRKYFTLSGSRINKSADEPDVLYVASSPRYWPYSKYSADPPARAEDETILADTILGSEAGRYNKYIYNENVIQYTYGSNVYRYYSDGFLTYRYLGITDTVPRSMTGSALMSAYKFAARVKGLLVQDSDMILASVKKLSGGTYEFGFDYRINGLPVKIEYDMKDGSGKKLMYAIRIVADSKRVLECDWLLRDFRQQEKGMYNDRLLEVIGSRDIMYDDITIKGIDTGYYISNGEDRMLEPALIIQTDSGTVSVELIPQKGG